MAKSKFRFWTKEEDTIVTNNKDTHTEAELVVLLASEGYIRSRDAVGRRARRLGISVSSVSKVDPKASAGASVPKPPTKLELKRIEVAKNIDVQWEKILKMSEDFKEYPVNRTRGFAKPERRIVSLSDIHFPFQHDEFLEEAVNIAKGCDVLVLNGDIFDCYGISTFKKSKKIPLLREYAIVLEFLKGLVSQFPKIVLNAGNHEERFSGTLQTALQMTTEPPVGDDLMTRLARGDIYDDEGVLVGNYNWDNVIYNPLQSWWTKVGKTIFCHPRNFSRRPGATVKQAADWFHQIDHVGEWDSIVMGHTHQAAKFVYEGRLMMEQACLTAMHGYQWASHIRYVGQANGFAEIWQDKEGNTNYDKSRVIYLGQQHPPTTEVVLNG